MKRRHLPELEDETWFPTMIRDFGTDYLQFLVNATGFYKNLVPTMQRGLAKAKQKVVIDIAAGGGGGWKNLGPDLKAAEPDVKVVLTDYFPNLDAFKALQQKDPSLYSFRSESVNALDVPKDLEGFRTQFLSFHHFRPADATKILQNAVDCKAPIMIVEVTERNVGNVIKMFSTLLISPFIMLFIRPFKIWRLFFTFIIPILPLFIAWDGIASVFRSYHPEEIEAMTKSLNNADSFTWEIAWHGKGQSKILIALGLPK